MKIALKRKRVYQNLLEPWILYKQKVPDYTIQHAKSMIRKNTEYCVIAHFCKIWVNCFMYAYDSVLLSICTANQTNK